MVQTRDNVNIKTAIILISIFGFFILVGLEYTHITNSLYALEFETIDFALKDVSILPPSATLLVIYEIKNPTNVKFEMMWDVDIYVGETYITTLKSDIETIRAKDTSRFITEAHISSSTLGLMMSGELENMEPTFSGTIKVTAKLFGIFPINLKLDASKFLYPRK